MADRARTGSASGPRPGKPFRVIFWAGLLMSHVPVGHLTSVDCHPCGIVYYASIFGRGLCGHLAGVAGVAHNAANRLLSLAWLLRLGCFFQLPLDLAYALPVPQAGGLGEDLAGVLPGVGSLAVQAFDFVEGRGLRRFQAVEPVLQADDQASCIYVREILSGQA